jgi:hypothetical protein
VAKKTDDEAANLEELRWLVKDLSRAVDGLREHFHKAVNLLIEIREMQRQAVEREAQKKSGPA